MSRNRNKGLVIKMSLSHRHHCHRRRRHHRRRRCRRRHRCPRHGHVYFVLVHGCGREEISAKIRQIWQYQNYYHITISSHHNHGPTFQNFTRHFLVNSADRPGIYANPNQIRANPGTIGRIRPEVACRFFKLQTA